MEWFKHDLKSRTHPRLQHILMRYGMEGIGLYWSLVEMLYEHDGSLMLTQCECYAFALRTHPERLIEFIKESGAFEIEGEMFYSTTVNERIEERNQRSSKARKSAKKRWSVCERNANAMRTHNTLDANAMRPGCEGNAIREEKIREEKRREEETPHPLKPEPAGQQPRPPEDQQEENRGKAGQAHGQPVLPLLGALEGPLALESLPERANAQPGKKTRQKRSQSPQNDAAVFLRFSEVPELESILKDWLAYKAERNERYKPTGLNQFLARVEKRVEELGAKEVIARMQNAMASNWAGWDFEATKAVAVKNSPAQVSETFQERNARLQREMILKLSYEEAGYSPQEAERLSKLPEGIAQVQSNRETKLLNFEGGQS